MLFDPPAYAQTAESGGLGLMLTNMAPFFLIIVVFYFLLIRPQQKRQKAHQVMLDNLRRGDQVQTSGGLIGKITKVGDSEVTVELAENVRVRAVKSTIVGVQVKGEPVSADDTATGETNKKAPSKSKKKLVK